MSQEEYREITRQLKAFLFMACMLSGVGMLFYAGLLWRSNMGITGWLMLSLFFSNGILVIFFGFYETLNAYFNKKSILLIDEATD